MSSAHHGTALVKAACVKWPDLPSRTLARMLCSEHKLVWPNLDAARLSVQYFRGRIKKKCGCKTPAHSTCPGVAWNPSALPEAEPEDFLPHIVSVAKDTRALVLGDIHLPYHNLKAVKAALEIGRKEDCRLILLNGDTLDFHRLSRFEKDPTSRKPKEEVDSANRLLDVIDDLFPKARKIWKDGNHDERYDHYLANNAAEIYSLVKSKCSLDRLLELEERGWEYVTAKRPIYLGKLTVLHGHELPTPVIGPVNAARGLFLRTKASAIVNHHHQVSEHSEPDIRDKLITTWSIGCLCHLHPYYARYNRWAHGAATVDLARGGDFKVRNYRINDGEVL